MQKVYIKGMVCNRCISTVKGQLESIGLELLDINLGEVTLAASTNIADMVMLEEHLKPLGFSILADKRKELVKEVKALVEEVYNGNFDFPYQFRFSSFVAGKLKRDYDGISAVFSSMELVTLEKYILDCRVEKVKEFLIYTSQTLAAISFRLGFSSVAHLSRQFKMLTGFNPSQFKSIRTAKEKITGNFI